MFRALKNFIQRMGGVITRSLVLIAALMFVSDSFATPIKKLSDASIGSSCLNTVETSNYANSHHSAEGSLPCSDSAHCHQHNCQTLATEKALVEPFDVLSFSGIEPARAPVGPFLDRVPRPPAV